MSVLVTGAGGPAGVCTIKALKKKHVVVAVDMDSFASGLYLADRSYKVPSCTDPTYIPTILSLACKNDVDFVFPTVGEELALFAKAAPIFKIAGIDVAVSTQKSIEIANNKRKTYQFFEGKPYCPEVYDKDVCYPCVVKPAESRGSRGFHICGNSLTLEIALKKNEDYGDSLIMEYLTGTEYSVYGLSNLNGYPIFSVANERIVTKGESRVALLTQNHASCKVANTIANELGLVGAWNIQLMEQKDGSYKLVEINPRIAGSASLVVASGVDYIGLIKKIFRQEMLLSNELECKTNRLFMIRYNEEIFVKPEELCGL